MTLPAAGRRLEYFRYFILKFINENSISRSIFHTKTDFFRACGGLQRFIITIITLYTDDNYDHTVMLCLINISNMSTHVSAY